jgi:hypothetical protein
MIAYEEERVWHRVAAVRHVLEAHLDVRSQRDKELFGHWLIDEPRGRKRLSRPGGCGSRRGSFRRWRWRRSSRQWWCRGDGRGYTFAWSICWSRRWRAARCYQTSSRHGPSAGQKGSAIQSLFFRICHFVFHCLPQKYPEFCQPDYHSLEYLSNTRVRWVGVYVGASPNFLPTISDRCAILVLWYSNPHRPLTRIWVVVLAQ